MKPYQGLYESINELIDHRMNAMSNKDSTLATVGGVVEYSDRKLNEIANEFSKLFPSKGELRELSAKLDDLSLSIQYLVDEKIVSGLDVIATDPPSDEVTISAGYGGKRGRPCRLDSAKTIKIPLDDSTSVFYINLKSYGQISIQGSDNDDDLTLAKIIIPNPGVTTKIQDDKPTDSYDGYIVSAKDAYFDEDQAFDDASLQVLRDAIGDILADNLIGNIRLSEDLRITNTQGTIELNSKEMLIKGEGEQTLAKFDKDGIYFFNTNGDELSHFTTDEARIGNILIRPRYLESQGFAAGSNGFRISDTGDAEFNDIIARGTIYASLGDIGGFTIGATTLKSKNNKIILDSLNELVSVGNTSSTYIKIDGANNRIETSDYVSGTLGKGFRIATDISEFQNVTVRGKISTSVFEKESISAIGGNFMALSADNMSEDMTALDNSTLTLAGDITLSVNDIIRVKDLENDEWMKVDSVSGNTYTVTRDKASLYSSNDNPTWKKGTAVVNYKTTGSGGIFMTSSEPYSPYLDFFTHSDAPWSNITVKTRIGRLDGVAGCSGYGIYGGAGYLGKLQVIDAITISSTGTIRSNLSGQYPYVEFSNSGIQLRDIATGDTYGYGVYSTAKYGFGALVWIMNSAYNIPWMELKEPSKSGNTVASLRLFNRTVDPTGAAEVGDLAVVGGKLKICTVAGDVGAATWTIVGSQS